MVNAPPTWSIEDEYKDIESGNYLRHVKEKTSNDPAEVARAKAALQHLARDHARVPMQWDSSPHAGFTTGKAPWMRAIENYEHINVANQVGDKHSVLGFWRQMLKLRKVHRDVLIHGDFRLMDRENPNTFVFEKRTGSQVAVVALNFTDEEQTFDIPGIFADGKATRIACNYDDEVRGPLRSFEGRIYLGTAAQTNGA